MDRILGICLFTFLSFLTWLYIAANHSTVDDWWTVKAAKEITLSDKNITLISQPTFVISPLKVLVGLLVSILITILLSLITIKKKH